MQVYLLRHGIAEEGRGGRPDSDRRLTEEGKRKLRCVLERASAAAVKPTLILTSPYVRAVQTAELAAAILGYKGSIVSTDALLPFSPARGIWQELRNHSEENSVLLAGHEPLLGETAAHLLGAPPGVVEMKKGALARIDIEVQAAVPRGVLQWLLTARLASESD